MNSGREHKHGEIKRSNSPHHERRRAYWRYTQLYIASTRPRARLLMVRISATVNCLSQDVDNVELDSLIGGNTPGDVTSLNCDLGPWPRVNVFC